jgi:HemY protein
MIRVLVYLVAVAALAFGAVWLADRPGDVAIIWQGRHIETSLMVLIAMVLAAAALLAVLWSALRALLRAPGTIRGRVRAQRAARGYRAVSQGLVAVGAGDLGAAKRFAEEARRIAPGEPLTLLLSAQAAQLSGDRVSAAASFEHMAARPETRLLGLHGLFVEARRRNDPAAALLYADEAAKQAAVPPWAGQAVLEFRCLAGDWAGALERLERNQKGGLIDKAAYRRQRAVLLTAQALGLEDTERERARSLAVEAAKLAPDLVPAAALAGRLLGEAGERRKAARIIEAAWRGSPHPDLAEAYGELRAGEGARERLARIEALAAMAPSNIEAALAVARAALDAREFVTARQALAPLTIVPTRRVAALMAELEEMQGDEGRAREWMARALHARRDPAWTADGFVSERWLPVSPVSGHLDAFAWKDPLAGEDHAAMLIEAGPRADARAVPPPRDEEGGERALVEVPPRPPASPAASPAGDGSRDEASPGSRASSDSAPRTDGKGEFHAAEPPPPREPPPRRARTLVPLAPAVIPLVHAPDDPGPEPEAPAEPEPESTTEPSSEGWKIIRGLFKP